MPFIAVCRRSYLTTRFIAVCQELAVGPGQDALIISTATDSSLGFTRPVTVASGGLLSVSGSSTALSVAFMGVPPLAVEEGGTLSISGVRFFSTCDPIRMLIK